jgi:hypothetical protein
MLYELIEESSPSQTIEAANMAEAKNRAASWAQSQDWPSYVHDIRIHLKTTILRYDDENEARMTVHLRNR